MEKKSKNKTQVLAYSRRQKENDTFSDIADALPIQENAKDLDKASILRLAINYLKLRDMIRDGNNEESDSEEEGQNSGDVAEPKLGATEIPPDALAQTKDSQPSIAEFLPNFSKDAIQALDGFLMVVSSDGRILFSSESISNYLGLRQVDVIGQKVQDIVHPQDCSEVHRIFQSQGHDSEHVYDQKDPLRRKFVLRMRCAFTPSVRSISRCSNFKPIFCSCFLKFGRSGPGKGQFLGMVVFCKLATVSKIKEMVVGTFFKTRHSLDLSYTFVDTRIRWILGYDPTEMTGLKAYQYFHPQDLGVTSRCHMNLLSHGVSHSPCYRFLTRWGDWVWCRSKSEMLFNKKSQLPEGIVIYTWIVRVAEEDDRMLAVKNGEDGEDKKKKYDTGFSSSISCGTGTLDIAALANPTSDEPKMVQNDLSPQSTNTSSETKFTDSSLPSPPQSAESSPNHPQLSNSYGLVDQGFQTTSIASSPPVGMGMVGGVYSPPSSVVFSHSPGSAGASSPPVGMGMVGGVYSPPSSVVFSHSPGSAGASSPPVGMGMVGGVYSPPSSVVFSHSPGSAGSPNSHVVEWPPNVGPVISDPSHMCNTSTVVDQSLCQTPPTQHSSFALSPPYTPYSHDQTPPNYFSNNAGLVNEQKLMGPEMGDCQFAAGFAGMPSSYNQGMFSPDMSMPLFDPMPPPAAAANYGMPPEASASPPFSQSDNLFASSQSVNTNPTMMPTNQILSMSGHVTQHYCNQSSIPSPPMEPQFVANSNGMEAQTGYYPCSDNNFTSRPPMNLYQSSGAHVKQSTIAETRARYGGMAPTHTHVSAGSHREVGPMRGQNPRQVVDQDSSGDMGSGTSPQWSQWLKNGPPEPVC